MSHLKRSVLAAAALVAVAVLPAGPALAQRMSLAERVDRLEQQQSSAQGGGSVELVNQISALQSQVQSLQGQVEELKHSLDESRQRTKDQYVDLDSRIGRLEGGAGAGTAGAPPHATPPRNANPPDVDLGTPPGANGAARNDNVGVLSAADRSAVPGNPTDGADAAVATAPSAAPDPAAETAAYNDAFAALKDGRYAESARKFQSFIDQYPDSQLASNAYYWLGESYYVTQNYGIAEKSFNTLLSRFPQSPKAADALLKVGYSQYEQKQWDQAEATLNQVVQSYPDTTAARLAQGRLRALQSESRR